MDQARREGSRIPAAGGEQYLYPCLLYTSLPEEERQLFVETLFQVIDQTGVTTLTEFSEHWKENLKSCLKSLKNLDPETRKRIRRIIKILLEIYGNTLRGEKGK